MVSTKGRYALRVMIDIAQHKDEGYISLKDVAERQEISMKYLELIAAVPPRDGAGGTILFDLQKQNFRILVSAIRIEAEAGIQIVDPVPDSRDDFRMKRHSGHHRKKCVLPAAAGIKWNAHPRKNRFGPASRDEARQKLLAVLPSRIQVESGGPDRHGTELRKKINEFDPRRKRAPVQKGSIGSEFYETLLRPAIIKMKNCDFIFFPLTIHSMCTPVFFHVIRRPPSSETEEAEKKAESLYSYLYTFDYTTNPGFCQEGRGKEKRKISR